MRIGVLCYHHTIRTHASGLKRIFAFVASSLSSCYTFLCAFAWHLEFFFVRFLLLFWREIIYFRHFFDASTNENTFPIHSVLSLVLSLTRSHSLGRCDFVCRCSNAVTVWYCALYFGLIVCTRTKLTHSTDDELPCVAVFSALPMWPALVWSTIFPFQFHLCGKFSIIGVT